MVCKPKQFVASAILLILIPGNFFLYPGPDFKLKEIPQIYDLVDSEPIVILPSSIQLQLTNNKEQGQSRDSGENMPNAESQVSGLVSLSSTVLGRMESDFGEIVAGEIIVLHSPSLNTTYTTIGDDYGEFTFADLESANDYVITASPAGLYKRYFNSPLQVNQDQFRHDIILESIQMGVVTGTVLDSYDRPVAGLPLTMRSLESENWSIDVISDAYGAFTVPHFPEGRFQVSSESEQSLRSTGFIFDPNLGEPVILTIDSGPYSLGGRIYDESGQAFEAVNVVVVWTVKKRNIRSRSTRKIATDANGSFRFTGLGPGNHELIVSVWNEGVLEKLITKSVFIGVDAGEVDILVDTLESQDLSKMLKARL